MTTVSSNDFKFLNLARNEAILSPCLQRHGCIAVLNGHVIGKGYNNYRTSSSDGFLKNTCTCHAEIATLRNVYKLFNMKGSYLHQIKAAKCKKVV